MSLGEPQFPTKPFWQNFINTQDFILFSLSIVIVLLPFILIIYLLLTGQYAQNL